MRAARRWMCALPLVAALALAGCEPRPDLQTGMRDARIALADSVRAAGDTLGQWVADFYARRGDRAIWFDEHGATPAAGRAVVGLLSLEDHGLAPTAFASESLLARAARAPSRRPVRADQVAALAHDEFAFTAGCLRAGVALAAGRVPAEALDPAWHVAERRARALKWVGAQLHRGLEPESLLALAPTDTAYVRLQRAYAALRRHDRGDARLGTVALNLERRRWLAFERARPRLEVNIPDFRLTWFGAGDTSRTFRIVVGDTAHPTPVFTDAVAWLDLHPGWRLTRRIVAEEIVPGLRRDRAYLAKHDMEVLRTNRASPVPVAPDSVPWDSVYSTSHFPYLVRQRPGAKNPLGRVKFACPNDHDVYLHDTNARGLLTREYRALSHGCVRVAQPESLAARLLAGTRWAARDTFVAMFADTLPRRLRLPAGVPVDFSYWTAWADAAGELHVRRDLYGIDRRLAAWLRSPADSAFVLNPESDWRTARPR